MTWDHPRSAIISHPVTFYRSHTLHPRFLSGGWPNEIETSECHGNLFAKGRNMISIKHAQNVLNHHPVLVNAKLILLLSYGGFTILRSGETGYLPQYRRANGQFPWTWKFKMLTAPNTNISPQRWWLEDYFPFEMIPFPGNMLNRGVFVRTNHFQWRSQVTWIQVRVVPEKNTATVRPKAVWICQLQSLSWNFDSTIRKLPHFETSESSCFPKAPLGPGEATSQVQAVLSSLMDDPSLP